MSIKKYIRTFQTSILIKGTPTANNNIIKLLLFKLNEQEGQRDSYSQGNQTSLLNTKVFWLKVQASFQFSKEFREKQINMHKGELVVIEAGGIICTRE